MNPKGNGVKVCARCGSPRYSWRSAFCARCGSSSFHSPKTHNAAAPRTGWKSTLLIVRPAIYIVCIPAIIEAAF